MPVNIKPLFDKLMKDPDIVPPEGKNKEEAVKDYVLQRAKQSVNNEKALNLARDDNSVNKLLDFLSTPLPISKEISSKTLVEALALMFSKGHKEIHGLFEQFDSKNESPILNATGKGAESQLAKFLNRLSRTYHPDMMLSNRGLPTEDSKESWDKVKNSEKWSHLDDSMKEQAPRLANYTTSVQKDINKISGWMKNGSGSRGSTGIKDSETVSDFLNRMDLETAETILSRSPAINKDLRFELLKNMRAASKKGESASDLLHKETNGELRSEFHAMNDRFLNPNKIEIKDPNDILGLFDSEGGFKPLNQVINFSNRAKRLEQVRDYMKEFHKDVKFDPNHPELAAGKDSKGKPIPLDTVQLNRYLGDAVGEGTKWGGPKLDNERPEPTGGGGSEKKKPREKKKPIEDEVPHQDNTERGEDGNLLQPQPGDSHIDPRSGKVVIVQHSYRSKDEDDPLDYVLFEFEDGSGGFTSTSDYTKKEHGFFGKTFQGAVHTFKSATNPSGTSSRKNLITEYDDSLNYADDGSGEPGSGAPKSERNYSPEPVKKRKPGEQRPGPSAAAGGAGGGGTGTGEDEGEGSGGGSGEGEGSGGSGEEEEPGGLGGGSGEGSGGGTGGGRRRRTKGSGSGGGGGTQKKEEKRGPHPDEQAIRDLYQKAQEEGVLQHMYEKVYGKDNPFKSFESFVEEKLNAALQKPNLTKVQGEFGKAYDSKTKADKKIKDDEQAEKDKQDATDKKERSDKANDISDLTKDLPEGTSKQDATDQYRNIMSHLYSNLTDLSDASKKKLKVAAEKLINNHGADYQTVDNFIDQHAKGDTDEERQKNWNEYRESEEYQNDVGDHNHNLNADAEYAEHVEGESGRAARVNSFENNDHGRVVHVDDDGKVTHTTHMHGNFEGGRKKVEEKGDARGASTHAHDHEEVHGGESIGRDKQGHVGWRKEDAGNPQLAQAKQDYAAAFANVQHQLGSDKPDQSVIEENQAIMQQLEKDNPSLKSSMMSDTEKEQQRIDRGQPPGPPPRPGLVWAPGIHHWVTPEKLSELQGALNDGEGTHISPEDFQALLGHHEVDPYAAHADGSMGHQGGSLVTKFGLHRVGDATQGTPDHVPANSGGSNAHGTPFDLAAQALAHVIHKLGGTGKSGKIAREHLEGTGINQTRSHTKEGVDIAQASGSAYIDEVADIARKERNEKLKARLNSAMGRFRAIWDQGTKETTKQAAKAIGRGTKKAAKKAGKELKRGGGQAYRDFMGEYHGTSGVDSLKVFGRDLKREGRALKGAAPIVGPQSWTRRHLRAAKFSAKKGMERERYRTAARKNRRTQSAVNDLLNRTRSGKQEGTENSTED